MMPQAPPAPEPATGPSATTGTAQCGELRLTAERLAALAPKLRALLDDFAHLTALESPELEPAFGTVATREGDDDAR